MSTATGASTSGRCCWPAFARPKKSRSMPPIEEVLEPLDAAALRRVLLELATDPESCRPHYAAGADRAAAAPRSQRRAASLARHRLRTRHVVDGSIEQLGAAGKAIQQLIEKADYAGALKLITDETKQQVGDLWRVSVEDFYDFLSGENPAEDAINALACLAAELALSLPNPKDPLMQQIAQLARGWLQQELDPWGDGDHRTCVGALVSARAKCPA
jgi:hypothetical protein